jgi:hypothetical protein
MREFGAGHRAVGSGGWIQQTIDALTSSYSPYFGDFAVLTDRCTTLPYRARWFRVMRAARVRTASGLRGNAFV